MSPADTAPPVSPHDHFFKYVFSNPQQAAAYLQTIVPDVLTTDLDWDSLRLRVGSTVDETLRERRTDLLFEIRFRGDRRDGTSLLLFLLLEHQSTSPFLMGWRKLEYMVRSWGDWLRENPRARALPVIFPVVLYTGTDAWSAPLEFADLLDWDGGVPPGRVRPYLPNFQYLLIKLFFVQDEDIAGLPLGRVALRLMKHARTPDLWDTFLEQGTDLQQILQAPDGLKVVQAILKYTLEVSHDLDFPRARVTRFIRESFGEQTAETIMNENSAAAFFMRKGEERGRALGIEQGIEQGIQREHHKYQELLTQLLHQRFGELPDDARQRVRQADPEAVRRWIERIVQARSLDDIFIDG